MPVTEWLPGERVKIRTLENTGLPDELAERFTGKPGVVKFLRPVQGEDGRSGIAVMVELDDHPGTYLPMGAAELEAE